MEQIDIDDVRDFFPQNYFGEQDPPEITFLDTASFGWPPSIDSNPNDIGRNVQQARQRPDPIVRKERRPPKPSKPIRYHYLPNPDYVVAVNHVPCSKVGRTWVARYGNEKWVMLKRDKIDSVKSASARKFVAVGGSEFVSKSFASPIHVVKLWNFYDPVNKMNDVRFFWVQTIFNA